MLDVTPSNLIVEITSAEKFRDEHLKSMDSQIARFHGPAWRGTYDWSGMAYDPKNRGFQFIARFLPEVAGKNPRFSIRSKRGPAQRMVAEAMRHGMNRWARDTNVKRTIEQVASWAQFTYGVLCAVQVPNLATDQGAKEPAMRPQLYCKDPKEFFMDALAKDPRDARFMGHVFAVDKEDLEKRAEAAPEEGWNLDVIKGLAADTGVEKLNRGKPAESSRSELVGYSVWVPEYELPFGPAEQAKYGVDNWRAAGFNGTNFTIAVGAGPQGDTDGQEIRAPQPAYCHPSGPYQVVGMYYVPGSPMPLGTLTAVEAQNQELNTHARAYLRSAARRKKMAVVGAGDALLTNAVKNAQDGDVVTANVADIQKNLVELEVGGPTAEQRLSILDLEANLNDALGTSSAVSGNVTGQGTATENMIAAQGSGSRMSWNKTKFDGQISEACTKIAWYLYHDDRVSFPLGDEAGSELGIEDPWFRGGTHEEGSGFTFDDLEMEIEANSMSLVDEAQEREKIMGAYSIVMGWLPLMVQFPVPQMWNAAIEDVGNAFGIPDLAQQFPAEQIIQSAMAMMALQAGAMGGGMGAAPGGGEAPQGAAPPTPTPRLAGDSGLPRNAGMGMRGGMAAASRQPAPNKDRQKLGNQAVKQKQAAGMGGGY